MYYTARHGGGQASTRIDVFTWVLQCWSNASLVKGKMIGIDASTLEANAPCAACA